MRRFNLVPLWSPLFLHRRALNLAVQQLATNQLGSGEACETNKLSILDIGCGNMPYEDHFRRMENVQEYTGADITLDERATILIDQATERINANNSSFDVVVHFQVLEHVPHPQAMIHECFRILKPGGVLLVTVPFIWEYHGVPGDFHRWTDEGLQTDLSSCGFADIEIYPIESQIESFLTIGMLLIARRIGWFWPKPLFFIFNLVGLVISRNPNRIFTLTYACRATKPIN